MPLPTLVVAVIQPLERQRRTDTRGGDGETGAESCGVLRPLGFLEDPRANEGAAVAECHHEGNAADALFGTCKVVDGPGLRFGNQSQVLQEGGFCVEGHDGNLPGSRG